MSGTHLKGGDPTLNNCIKCNIKKLANSSIMCTLEHPCINASPIPTSSKSQIFSFPANPHIEHVLGILFSRSGKNYLPSWEKGGIVGTMGSGPDPPANKLQQTPSHRSMAQSI